VSWSAACQQQLGPRALRPSKGSCACRLLWPPRASRSPWTKSWPRPRSGRRSPPKRQIVLWMKSRRAKGRLAQGSCRQTQTRPHRCWCNCSSQSTFQRTVRRRTATRQPLRSCCRRRQSLVPSTWGHSRRLLEAKCPTRPPRPRSRRSYESRTRGPAAARGRSGRYGCPGSPAAA